MKDSTEKGMITFDKALLTLYRNGNITLEEAIYNADSKNDLSLAIWMGSDDDSAAGEDGSELILG